MDRQQLNQLLLLQEKEEKLFRLLKEKNNILKELKIFSDKLAEINSKISEIHQQKENLSNDIEKTIRDIEQYEKSLKKMETAIKSIKSKEHYKNMLRERSKTENTIINAKNKLKQLNLKLEQIENSKELKSLKIDQTKTKDEIKNLEEDLYSIENSIKKAEKDIIEYENSLDKELVNFYNDIKKRVIPVFVALDKRACSYCGNILPIDSYNKLIQNDINIFMCPSCQRIIYKLPNVI